MAAAPAADLDHRIRRLLDSSQTASGGFWGIQIVDLEDARVIYEQNSHRFFVPASNTKLFTTALALVRLGSDYRYVTSVTADQPPDQVGRIRGCVRLVGGGD